MRIRIRFSAGCAVFALIVSLLSGVIAGLPVGTIIVRALIAGMVFFGAGSGLQLAVARFLPELDELFVRNSAMQDQDTRDTSGNRRQAVDIVVDDDNGMERVEFSPAGDALDAADDGLVDVEPEFESDDQPEAATADDLVAEAEEVEADADRKTPVHTRDPSDSIDADGVDRLPDGGGFHDAFEEVEGINPANGEDGQPRSRNQDPAVMARALQTVLKRDE
ncbi:MAG: hypothetical protein EA384_05120 [Spirochaetaceae bacterium]|nr:MAG: hypothetical protein EA384_05120 [Spirochaetaceae bacterium]